MQSTPTGIEPIHLDDDDDDGDDDSDDTAFGFGDNAIDWQIATHFAR